MSATSEAATLFGNSTRLAALRETQKAEDKDTDADAGEASCPAFGYLRGLDARALAVELRFRDGNSEWYSYGLLSNWRHNPSVGLLLKFTSDVTTLVLIRGSNLSSLVSNGAVNLTDRGFQRHRILWVREMDEGELRQVAENGPTIDRIEVAEFESQEEQREWLKKTAPAFARRLT
jgi:hypothetical protein